MTPGHIDEAVVRRHLRALHGALANVKRHAGRTAAELRADADLRWAVERGLQLCAQNVVDVATHLCSAAGLDVPDYASAIDKLAELAVLPPEFASRFRAVAGFRNVLVHGYLEVDLDLVQRFLTERLGDFEEFAAHVERYLGTAG
jgi:uncharacterized protein YutE (UPF0331/DUF86 family)